MKKYKYFIVFSMIGILCTLIDYGIYLALLKITNYIVISKILSSVVSISVNYLLNSKFNFSNAQSYNLKYYSQYIIIYSFLISLNVAINVLFIRLTGSISISFWLAALIAAFVNYFTVKIYFYKINLKKIPN